MKTNSGTNGRVALKESEVDKYIAHYEAQPEYGGLNWGVNAIHFLRTQQPLSIADVGCGQGNFCLDAVRTIQTVYGVDIASVKMGKTTPHERIIYLDGDACACPLLDQSVEWVTCFDTLEHLSPSRVEQALAEFNRIATNGFLISVALTPQVKNGRKLHLTVKPLEWWKKKLSLYGEVSETSSVPITGIPYLVVAKKPLRPELKIVVYTALIGNETDFLLIPHWHPGNVQYVCFTDRDIPKPPPYWTVVKVDRDPGEAVRQAKKYKMLPWHYLPKYGYDYDVAIWLDANFQVLDGFENIIDQNLYAEDMLLFRHYERDCAYAEAEECKRLELDSSEIIDRQMERYRSEGFPEHYGLPECNTILSRDTAETRAIFGLWLAEVVKGSKRDQLSFSYAVWKSDRRVAAAGGTPRAVIISTEVARNCRYTWPHPHQTPKARGRIVLMVPLWNPEGEWTVQLPNLLSVLRANYEVLPRAFSSAYLFKSCNTLLGAEGMQFPDYKPFQEPRDILYSDYDYMLWMENDMILHDLSDASRLIRNLDRPDVDAVSALYIQPGGGLTYHVSSVENGYAKGADSIPTGTELFEARHIPLGFTAIRRGVIEKLEYPWFQPTFIRQQFGRFYKVGWVGHDAAFSDKLVFAGFKLWVDPSVRCGHIKKAILWPDDEAKRENRIIDQLAKEFPSIASSFTKKRRAVFGEIQEEA